MLSVLEVTAPIFALILAGFMAPRLKLLPEGGVIGINAFVFYFALPAMLFRVVAQQPLNSFNAPSFIAGYTAAGLIVFGYMLWISKPVHGIKQSIAYGINSAHGNVGYLGVALVTELAAHGGTAGKGLGSSVLAPIVLVIMCDILVIIVLAIACFEWVTQNERRLEQSALSGSTGKTTSRFMLLLSVVWGILKSPLVFSILGGLVMVLMRETTGLTLWAPIDTLIRILAAAAGPCALFAIGASLGNKKIDLSPDVLGITVMKLLVHPVVTAVFLFGVFKIDRLTAAIGVLAAALPAASNTFIIAERYQARGGPLASSILLGTVAAVITVSFVIWLLGLR